MEFLRDKLKDKDKNKTNKIMEEFVHRIWNFLAQARNERERIELHRLYSTLFQGLLVPKYADQHQRNLAKKQVAENKNYGHARRKLFCFNSYARTECRNKTNSWDSHYDRRNPKFHFLSKLLKNSRRESE